MHSVSGVSCWWLVVGRRDRGAIPGPVIFGAMSSVGRSGVGCPNRPLYGALASVSPVWRLSPYRALAGRSSAPERFPKNLSP